MAYVPKLRKSYFPYQYLLRSAPYQGKGAVVAENSELHDGRVRKIKSPEEWTDTEEGSAIIAGYNYKNDAGTNDKFIAYEDNTYYVLRILNESKVSTTPTLPEANEISITGTLTFTNGSDDVSATSGAFTTELSVGDLIYLDGEYASRLRIASITDNNNLVLESNYAGTGGSGTGKRSSPHYTSSIFSFRQIGKYLFVGNNSTTLPLCRWDGTTLSPSANAPDEIGFLVRDKNRAVAGEPRQTSFSEEDFATSNNWQGNTGAKSYGTYKTEIVAPKAGVEAGSGIIICGEIGCSAQKVIPNNASDDISADTSIDGFTSVERGVDNPNKLCAAKGFVFKLNPDGIHQMNPFNGESTNLTDTGQMSRIWKNFNTDNGIIIYDIKNEWVVACVQLGARNDTLIVIDVKYEERPIFIVPNSYYSSLFVSGGELFAGSSGDGKIYKVFELSRTRIQYSHEWDGIDTPVTEKKIKKVSFFVNVHPLSSFTANLYIDGSSTPFWTREYDVSQASEKMSDGAYECYVFEAGDINLFSQGVDYIETSKARKKFSTIRFEVIENSQYDFELLDVTIEYKSKNKFVKQKSMNRLSS